MDDNNEVVLCHTLARKIWILKSSIPDGQPITLDNVMAWKGKWHKSDGPAVEWSDGIVGWYWFGHFHTFDKWLAVNNLISDDEKLLLKLQYGK